MNLNAGAHDGIVDGDLIAVPQAIPSNDNPITVIPENDFNKVEGIVPQEELDKLTDSDVTFKLVTNGASKIVDLKDVEAEILSNNTMDTGTAETINASFEGLFDGPVKLQAYTKSPSKTNLAYALKHMKLTIAKEEATLITNFQLLIDQPIATSISFMEDMLANYIPTVESGVMANRGLAIGLKDKLEASKNVVYPAGDDFINLLRMDMNTVDASSIRELKSDTFVGAIEGIKKILQYPYFNAFAHGTLNGEDLEHSTSHEAKAKYAGAFFGIFDLIKLYESGDILDRIDTAVDLAKERIDQLKTIQQDSDKLRTDVNAINKFLVDESKNLQDCFFDIDHLGHIVNSLSVFNVVSKELLTIFSML